MGFNLAKVLPGDQLNIGERGVSTSIGVRCPHVTVDHVQVRETVDLPGTGLSYIHVEGVRKTAAEASGQAQLTTDAEPLPRGRAWAALAVAIVAWRVWPAR